MKKEIYITILLFALMLFALAAAVVQAGDLTSNCKENNPNHHAIFPINDLVGEKQTSLSDHSILPQLSNSMKGLTGRWSGKKVVNAFYCRNCFKRGLQVVNWSGRTFELLHSLTPSP